MNSRRLVFHRHGSSALLVSAVALAVATGCSTTGPGGPGATNEQADFTLQLLHFADVDGSEGALDDVDAFSALVDGFRAEYPDETVLLSSGDNFIPGPRFAAASDDSLAPLLGVPGEGRADIAFLNAMGVQASAIGNHDLDTGPGGLAGLIARSTEVDEDSGESADYAGADFPYLSANLDFTGDEDLGPLAAEGGQPAAAIAGRVAPSTTLEVGGRTIGVVGATTPALASITTTGGVGVLPDDATDLDALAGAIQPAVDALVAQGIDVIVLLAHMQQIAIEQALATRLNDVDIIVAGGSNTLLADDDDALRPSDVASDGYPLQYESPTGEPVLLVNTDGDYRYLGRLRVGFDAEGRVLPGTLDAGINGAQAATADAVARLDATPIPAVATLSQTVRDVLAVRDGNTIGRTAVYLDGRRSQVRTQETNLGNLTADANLWLAAQADSAVTISLKNGGGIRAPIGLEVQPPGTTDPATVQFLPPPANDSAGKAAGDVSQFDLETALRFNNGLTLLSVTATELKDILEHGVAATEPGAAPGQFPQVGGLAFSFDPSQTARQGSDTNGDASVPGERVQEIRLLDAAGGPGEAIVADGEVVADSSRLFRLVILDFIAQCVPMDGAAQPDGECGDGYPLKGLTAPARADLTAPGAVSAGPTDFAESGSEQDALGDYLATFFSDTAFDVAETSAQADQRIRNLAAGAASME